MSTINKVKVNKLTPLNDTIIVSDMEFTERISNGGIIILNDDMKSAGIRPRWGKVYAIGPKVKDIEVGQYIMIAHGRWTRGITIDTPEGEKVIRKVDNQDILLVSEDKPQDETMSDKVY
jgi:co-chaperonin GroES (HSP10)